MLWDVTLFVDIDECSQGLSACHPNSACVNIPGSYYCQCREGYHSNYQDNRHGALCKGNMHHLSIPHRSA